MTTKESAKKEDQFWSLIEDLDNQIRQIQLEDPENLREINRLKPQKDKAQKSVETW
jgi:hypothetical protein